MPRPHVHPSESCYKRHGCRCAACGVLNTRARRRERAGVILTKPRRRRATAELGDGT